MGGGRPSWERILIRSKGCMNSVLRVPALIPATPSFHVIILIFCNCSLPLATGVVVKYG